MMPGAQPSGDLSNVPSGLPASDESALLAALRRGDEAAFVELVGRHQRAMLRVASAYVPSRAVAEEVVQETWLGVLQGLARFEGRSSLKTWIFRILVNRARTRGEREGRSIPFSDLAPADAEGPTVDPERFLPAGHPDAGWWAGHPASWDGAPEQRLLAGEARGQIEAAIAALPDSQRAVISLRDVEGWGSAEVCDLLGISEGNQRVLLHRARAKVRQALAGYLVEEG